MQKGDVFCKCSHSLSTHWWIFGCSILYKSFWNMSIIMSAMNKWSETLINNIRNLSFLYYCLVVKTFHLLIGNKTPSEYVCIHLNLDDNNCLILTFIKNGPQFRCLVTDFWYINMQKSIHNSVLMVITPVRPVHPTQYYNLHANLIYQFTS